MTGGRMTDNPSRQLSGWHGRYRVIDVGSRQTTVRPIPAGVLRAFVGGAGLGTWILHQLTDAIPGYDPLGPAAPLIFCFSPLVGSPLTTSAKFAVVSRSPLTGCLNDSLSSSRFAISGKKTGCDAIVLTGVSDSWVSVSVDEDQVTFRDASEVTGRSAAEAAQWFRAEAGADFDTAAIGVAGEQRVRFATISHDRRHAGRGGSGAVMGSKRVKLLAVRGARRVPFADPSGLADYSRQLSRLSLSDATAKYRETGTVVNLVTFNRLGTLPTRNFRESRFEAAEQLSGMALQGSGHRLRQSCAACTVGCEHIFVPADGDADAGVRLEYESLYALGPMCGVAERDVVLEAARRCDELGIDTISAGATIAFAMECGEQGLLAEPDLRFGSGEQLLTLLDRIGTRAGLGDLLADGSRAAAARIGGGSERFAPHVKGLEIPGYDPRSLQLMALGFAVGTRGADHNRSGAYEVDFSARANRFHAIEDDVALAVQSEDESTLMDALILCRFLRGVFPDRLAAMSDMLALTTGVRLTPAELTAVAARIVDARKLFNIRHGWTPADDTLPPRLLDHPVASGSRSDVTLGSEQLAALVRSYNRLRGWTAEGWLPEERARQRRRELQLSESSTLADERPPAERHESPNDADKRASPRPPATP